MLNMHVMPLGAYQTNCYIVWNDDGKECVIIDPGYEPETVLSQVNKLGKTVAAILLTHGHFDHVGAVKELAEATGCSVYLNTEDLSMPEKLTAGPLYYTHSYGEGDELHLAGLTIRVLHTPGHTPGSVCLLCEDALFAGDTLFARSCGRTDLAGGDAEAMGRSLKRLAALEGEYRVLPGHNKATLLSLEREYNPFMR